MCIQCSQIRIHTTTHYKTTCIFPFQKQVQEAEYGSDLAGVQSELKLHQNEHKTIEQFHSKVEHCINAKVTTSDILLYVCYNSCSK